MSITVIGCSSGPTVIQFEQNDIDTRAERPLNQCEWPELLEAVMGEQTIVYMTVEGLDKQAKCQVTEQTNYDIARNNADSVDNLVEAFNGLIDKAELHNNYAQNELTRVDDERKAKAMEVRWYQGLLAIVLIVVAL